jgi:putative ABC transport system permease protein
MEQVLTLVIHTNGDPAALSGPLRTLLRTHHPDMPISEIRTLPEYLAFARWMPRFFTSLMMMLSIVALIIAAVGLYGVMAYSVTQRTREIGIRMALGAGQQQVLGMVVGQAMRLTMLGCGIGLAAAYALTRFMAALLLGVSPTDPPTYIVVALILAVSGIAAAWVPAFRASRVDPMVALRYE